MPERPRCRCSRLPRKPPRHPLGHPLEQEEGISFAAKVERSLGGQARRDEADEAGQAEATAADTDPGRRALTRLTNRTCDEYAAATAGEALWLRPLQESCAHALLARRRHLRHRSGCWISARRARTRSRAHVRFLCLQVTWRAKYTRRDMMRQRG